MKKLICLLLTLALVGSLWACTGTTEPADSTGESDVPPSSSVLPETEPSETEAPTDPSEEVVPDYSKPLDLDLNFDYNTDVAAIPMLLLSGEGTEESPAVGEMLYWDLENHTLSDTATFQFSFIDAWWPHTAGVHVWPGDQNYVLFAEQLHESAEGVTCHTISGVNIQYGHCYYDTATGKLYELNEDGTLTEYAVPAVPAEICDNTGAGGYCTVEPEFATVVDGKIFVVYGAYDSWSDYGEVICCVYPVGQPEAAQWSVVPLPEEYHPSVFLASYELALIGSKLYITSRDDLLVLDLETNELSTLDAVKQLWALFEGATNFDPKLNDYNYVYPQGTYEDILIVRTIVTDADGQDHTMFAAVRDGQLISAFEALDGKTQVFYNGDLEQVGTCDAYATDELCIYCFPDDN